MYRMLPRTSLFLLSLGLAFFSGGFSANSADFPKKSIKLVVTAPAGGGEDMEARGIAPFMEKYLGVKVIIENQPGAGGKIAFTKFQTTRPDGYTLITYSYPKSIIMEFLGKTDYRTKDFTPIYIWSRTDNFIVVNAETWKTLDEMLQDAKTKLLSVGIPGIGGTSHLSGLMIFEKLGVKVNWVPYEAGAGSFAALAGKHLDAAMGSSITTLGPLIDYGKLRLLTCLSVRRNPFFPEVPTPRELGYDVTPVLMLRGVEAPPKTPPAVANVLEAAFVKIGKDPGFIDWAKKNKVVLNPVSAKEFAQVVEETYPQIGKVQHLMKAK